MQIECVYHFEISVKWNRALLLAKCVDDNLQIPNDVTSISFNKDSLSTIWKIYRNAKQNYWIVLLHALQHNDLFYL